MFVPRVISEAAYLEIENTMTALDSRINRDELYDAYSAKFAEGWGKTAERAAKKETEENA